MFELLCKFLWHVGDRCVVSHPDGQLMWLTDVYLMLCLCINRLCSKTITLLTPWARALRSP